MRRRRSARRSGGRRSGRRTRWLGIDWGLGVTLNSNPDTGREWVSFWAKFPASMADTARDIPADEESVISNEPVDETLVRTFCTLNGNVLVPGTGGAATNPTNFVFGIIPFNGGEFPEFYDFAIFQEVSSLVAPPNPIIQIDDPWVFRTASFASNEVQVFSNGFADLAFQSRAKRRLPAGVGLLCVLGVSDFFSSAENNVAFNIGGEVRMAVRSGFSV